MTSSVPPRTTCRRATPDLAIPRLDVRGRIEADPSTGAVDSWLSSYGCCALDLGVDVTLCDGGVIQQCSTGPGAESPNLETQSRTRLRHVPGGSHEQQNRCAARWGRPASEFCSRKSPKS